MAKKLWERKALSVNGGFEWDLPEINFKLPENICFIFQFYDGVIHERRFKGCDWKIKQM